MIGRSLSRNIRGASRSPRSGAWKIDRTSSPPPGAPCMSAARGGRALLVCGILLLAACAPAHLADLPDRPAGAPRAPSDDETRQQAIDSLRDAFLQRNEVAPGRQPVAPTFVPKATRLETVRAMLSMSNMGTRPYSLEDVYRRLDPSVRAGAEQLRAIGVEGDVEFQELLRGMADTLGACTVPIAQFISELRFDGRTGRHRRPDEGRATHRREGAGPRWAMCRWCRTWCAAQWRWTIPPTCRSWPTARSRCCGSGTSRSSRSRITSRTPAPVGIAIFRSTSACREPGSSASSSCTSRTCLSSSNASDTASTNARGSHAPRWRWESRMPTSAPSARAMPARWRRAMTVPTDARCRDRESSFDPAWRAKAMTAGYNRIARRSFVP